MINKVEKTIKQYDLISRNENIIIGVSGGPDSIFLLDILYKLSKKIEFNIYVAHINHGVRGKESDEDEKYVEDMCKNLRLPFYSKLVDMKEYAKENKMSEEEAGRELRYKFFRDIISEVGLGKIAVAHNKNDQAETLLMRFFRGSGIDGLKGMEYKNIDIIRPILDITRDEIEKYCKDNNLNPRIDKTNLMPIYSRNKVRLELIPYIMDNFNYGIIDTLARTSNLMQIESDFLKEESNRIYKYIIKKESSNEVILDKNKLTQIHFAMKLRVIRLSIEKIQGDTKNIEEKHVRYIIEMLDKNTGKSIDISNNIKIINSYDDLIIKKDNDNSQKEKFKSKIKINSKNYIKEINAVLDCKIITIDKFDKNIKNNFIKHFDYDKIKGDIYIRNKQNGDKFIPIGMNGSKKVKDFFIDEKIPREKRSSIPIIHDDENIIWIVGYRISELYKIDENSSKILLLEYKNERGNI